MKTQLQKSFPLPASADVAWTLLQDIEGVASCMPGAKVTERLDERHFKGTMAVKLGPAAMSFRGDIELLEIDPAARRLRLAAKGMDATGGSGAAMDLTAHIEAADAGTSTLVGNSEVSMSGKAATFGARMMGPVADQVMNQFAANFAARTQAMQAQAQGAAGAAPAAAAPPSELPPAKPLNALALVWAVLRDWLRSLFGIKRA